MRSLIVFAALIALIVAALVVTGYHPGAVVQEGTPPAEEFMLPEGVAFEILASGWAEEVPPGPALFEIFRLRLEPGAVFPIAEGDPSLGIPVVETGTVTMQVSAPITITRAATGDEPGAQEAIAASIAFTLNPGDSIVGPPNAGGEFCNDGAEPAVVLIAHIVPVAES